MIKSINIQGINRAASRGAVVPGQCLEIINARFKNGAYRPVGAKATAYTITAYPFDYKYYHPVLDTGRFIAYYEHPAYHTYLVYNASGDAIQQSLITLETTETHVSITHIGNVLVITTNLNKYFFLYNSDPSYKTYTLLEDLILPHFIFDVRDQQPPDETAYFADGWTGSGPTEALEGAYHELVATKKADGYFYGVSLIRIAYRLFDGSYIKHSFPFYVDFSLQGTGDDRLTIDIQLDDTAKFENILTSKLFFKFLFDTGDLDILESYTDVVSSLDIFITNPIPKPDLDDYYTNVSYPYKRFAYKNPDLETLWDDSQFYKIASYSIEELEDLEDDNVNLDIKNTANITTGSVLPIDNYSHHKLLGDVNVNFNSRLHIADINTKFFKGFGLSTYSNAPNIESYLPSSWTTPFQWSNDEVEFYWEISLNTTEGRRIIVTRFYPYIFGFTTAEEGAGSGSLSGSGSGSGSSVPDYSPFPESTSGFLLLNTLVVYPDPRAYLMRLVAKDTDGLYYEIDRFNLKTHDTLNYAHDYNLRDSLEVGYAYPSYKYIPTPGFYAAYYGPHSGIQTENKYLSDTNRIQVSEIDNPFVYLAEHSYQVGPDSVIIQGLGTIAEALSEGQFGIFPLYIFTDEGIWTMFQGSGDILYERITPLNRMVSSDITSVLAVHSGIMFISDKGLIFLSGREAFNLNENTVDGDETSKLESIVNYDIDNIRDGTVNILDYICATDFLTYLGGAILAYDYKNKEVIISNSSYDYSWVYSVESKMFHKISESFDSFISLYPGYLGINKAKTKIHDLTDEGTAYPETYIETKPFKLEHSYTKVMRLLFNAKLISGELDFAVVLFGEGKSNWVMLNGILEESTPSESITTIEDVMVRINRFSCKRYIIVIAGNLLPTSEIEAINIDYAQTFDKKLRK
jgi:hypothetical protein